jgi:hypothetical protein
MKALLAHRWGDLSLRTDFEQIKGDFAEELKGGLVNYHFDVLNAKEANHAATKLAGNDEAEGRAALRLLDTYQYHFGMPL